MKLIKQSLFLLAAAILFDGLLVFAATMSTAYFAVNIAPGQTITSSYKQKTSETTQSYTNTFTNTTLTSPCPNCVIGVRFESSNGDYTERAVMMDQTVYANNTGLMQVGTYRIKLWRSGGSLLNTYTSGHWDY